LFCKSKGKRFPDVFSIVAIISYYRGKVFIIAIFRHNGGLAFVLIVVLAIGGWLIYSQMRTYELTMSTGPKTGQAYAFGVALSKVVAEAEPRIRITMVESASSVESMQFKK
jgi:TRAP-type uncharacterized transport system substrate-binding protein